MGKIFNVSAACDPDLHYMVDITDKLMQIRRMVDAGQYFIINRARQYGKTTTLRELEKILKKDYIVVSLDFQMLGAASFQTENIFSLTFARIFLRAAQRQKDENTDRYRQLLDALGTAVLEKRPDFVLQELNRIFEMRLYNLFLAEGEIKDSEIYKAATKGRDRGGGLKRGGG